jgi:hypothetical protein
MRSSHAFQLTAAATALLIVWGCSSSSSSTGGAGAASSSSDTTGSTAATTGTTAATTTSATTSSTSTGGPTGTFAYCTPSGSGAVTICFAFPIMDGGASAATVCAADTENNETWISVASCQLPGLTGCCGMNDTWQCFYNAAGAESECTGDDGTWSATSP